MRLPAPRRRVTGTAPTRDPDAPALTLDDSSPARADGVARVTRRQRAAERRGTVATVVVAIVIGVLIVALQPGPKPPRPEPVAAPATTVATTTTVAPDVQLCALARQFAKDAEGLSPTDAARVAEAFFVKAVKLVDPSRRADFDALLRYYTEFNAIGTEFDYDLDRIAKAGRGDRWAQLLYRSPAGIDVAERTLHDQCEVTMPAPPTVITQPPTSYTPRRLEAGE